MKKALSFLLILTILLCAAAMAEGDKIEIKALIIPKFEVGEMTGDFPGEAQYYYEGYLEGSDVYQVADVQLYVKDGVALFLAGMGKVNASVSLASVLLDPRFDFSNAYILSTGCCGSAVETTVMGDVFVITAAVDYDLGHHADVRDMTDPGMTTWFHDEMYDGSSSVKLDPGLMERVYEMVKDVPLETTERTRKYMSDAFDGAAWAVRDPKVMRGTTVTGDNYWKGMYGHANALLMVETYGCADPFATTEMEEIAVAMTAKRLGMLDRLIVIRGTVNTDAFVLGMTPESLWKANSDLMTDDSVESADIFETEMKNTYDVGRIIIDAILEGKL